MKYANKVKFLFFLAIVLCFPFKIYGDYNNSAFVQTNYATYISNFQATLNGTLFNNNFYTTSSTNYTYFQWGTTTSYGNQTPQQILSYTGTFMQNIGNLNSGTTYHFRAVAQGNYGVVYGQDMTFTTTGGFNSGSILSITKQAININSGNLNWSSLINANPSDTLSFAITLQADGQDVHNVMVRDVLPANLIYKGNLLVNTNSNYGGSITSGVNIGTVYAGQAVIVSYQVQVAPASNFSYGSSTLANNATITSNEAGTQTASATVIVNNSQVYGATTGPTSVSTGLTNNFLTDSFLLPLSIIILGLWLLFSGNANKFANWLRVAIDRV
jgi:hypothetical protein